MPYIIKEYRKELEPMIDALAAKILEVHEVSGFSRGAIVNFTVSELVNAVWKDPRYADMAEARSALMEAFTEYGRRVMGPYEDSKIKLEGDIRNFNSPEYQKKNQY